MQFIPEQNGDQNKKIAEDVCGYVEMFYQVI